MPAERPGNGDIRPWSWPSGCPTLEVVTARTHGTPDRSSRKPSPLEQRFEWLLAFSRVLVVIPVVTLLLASFGGFVYGAVVFVHSLRDVVRHPVPVGNKIGLFLLVVDLFLVSATMLIAAIGLYELFVSRVHVGGERRIPKWLEMRDLNDLKVRVIAMIVMVVSVSFAQAVVDFDNSREILEVGAGIALVVGALTVFVRFGSHGGSQGSA